MIPVQARLHTWAHGVRDIISSMINDEIKSIYSFYRSYIVIMQEDTKLTCIIFFLIQNSTLAEILQHSSSVNSRTLKNFRALQESLNLQQFPIMICETNCCVIIVKVINCVAYTPRQIIHIYMRKVIEPRSDPGRTPFPTVLSVIRHF